MSWTNVNGVWTHSGSSLQHVVLRPGTAEFNPPASFVAAIPNFKVADIIGFRILTSPDFRSGWRVGIDPTDTTKFSVRRRIAGVLEAAGVGKSFTHGIAADTPFTVQVRVENDKITASITGVVGSVSFVNSTPPTFTQYNQIGVESAVDGARFGVVRLDDLNATFKTANNIRNIWANGDLYATLDGLTPSLLGSRVVPSGLPVSFTAYQSKGYAVCGSRTVVIDYIARTVGPYTANSGTLPGATDPGTTTGTLIEAHIDRVCIAAGAVASFAAAGDPLDWNYLSREAYRAYQVNCDEPIVAMKSTQFERFVIGTTNGLTVIVGDPIDNNVQRVTLGRDGGPTGPHSMEITAEGVLYVHTKAGILKGTVGGGMVPFSPPRLHQYLAVDDPSQWDICLIREPRFRLLYCTLRSKTSANPSVAVIYDEVADRWLVDEYVGGHFPLSSVLDNMEVLQGDTSGRVWSFDPTSKTDGGVQIPNVRCPLTSIDLAGDVGSVRVTDFNLRLTRGSDPVTVKLYGGSSLNVAYDRTYRKELAADTVGYGDTRKPMRVVDRAIVGEITMPSASRSFAIEEASASVEPWRGTQYGDFIEIQAGSLRSPDGTVTTSVEPGTGPGAGGGGVVVVVAEGTNQFPVPPILTDERPGEGGTASPGSEPETPDVYTEPATPYGEHITEDDIEEPVTAPPDSMPAQPVDPS